MFRSRTIKTLTALVASMTIGTFLLAGLRQEPIRPLAALQATDPPPAKAVFDKDVDFQEGRWRNIIVDASTASPDRLGQYYHFIISQDDEGQIQVTAGKLWRKQLAGRHTYVAGRDWNRDSVGVCLVGNFNRTAPPAEQYDSLVELVHTLQKEFAISGDQVYLKKSLDSRRSAPGRGFPEADFAGKLRKID
ncbi:MAG: peptidoglycan recognition family protein [Phycisphaerae bacterium]